MDWDNGVLVRQQAWHDLTTPLFYPGFSVVEIFDHKKLPEPTLLHAHLVIDRSDYQLWTGQVGNSFLTDTHFPGYGRGLNPIVFFSW